MDFTELDNELITACKGVTLPDGTTVAVSYERNCNANGFRLGWTKYTALVTFTEPRIQCIAGISSTSAMEAVSKAVKDAMAEIGERAERAEFGAWKSARGIKTEEKGA